MTKSDVERADEKSRVRAMLMALAAIPLIATAIMGVGDEASSMTPVLRHAIWGASILLWLVFLHTGGALRSGAVQRLMNDEVGQLNRSRAIQAGFWSAMLLGLILYFATLRWELSPREVLRLMLCLPLAAALLRYAWLERG